MVPTVAAEKQYAVEHSEPEWVTLQGEGAPKLMVRLVARLPQQQQKRCWRSISPRDYSRPRLARSSASGLTQYAALSLSRAMRRLREEWTR